MAKSEVDICNLALGIIRVSKTVEAFRGQGDGSVEAEQCDIWYDDTRDLVLAAADWPFARKRVALNLSGTAPDEYGYSYALPNDCLKVRGVVDGARVRTFADRLKYAIENDGTGHGRVILMDHEDATLIYTMRVEDPVIYPPEFVQALTWKLAASIARALDRNNEVINDTLQVAERMILRAAAACANENSGEVPPSSDLYTSRIA